MPQRKVKAKSIFGWREWVALPDMTSVPQKAKIDTGDGFQDTGGKLGPPETILGRTWAILLFPTYESDLTDDNKTEFS